MTDQTNSLALLLSTTDKTVFSTQDLNKAWKYQNYRSLVRRISYLKKNGSLIHIQRGLYAVAGRDINELELANKIRTPSYISFETVLYKSGVIFQWDNRITMAGKESFLAEAGGFKILFRQIKDNILLDMHGISKMGNYYIASKERALLDMLYIEPNTHFDNLRSINFIELRALAPLYGRNSIVEKIESLEEHTRSY